MSGEDWRAEARQRAKEKDSKKRFKLPEGETTFRLLPNMANLEKAPHREYRMHSEVGPNKRFVRCGKNIRGEGECWLCDVAIPKLSKSAKASSRAMAQRMEAKDLMAVQIIYMDENDRWVGPKLWEISSNRIAKSLLSLIGSTKRFYYHPVKGYDLTITRTGTGRNDTRYEAPIPADEPSAVPKSLLAKAKPWSELLKKYEEAAQKAAYYGHEQEEEPEEVEEGKSEETEAEVEEAEAPTPKKKKKPTPVEEEDEPATEEDEPAVDEDEPVAEEEEEEAPAPSKKKKKPAPVEDEDEPATGDDESLEEELLGGEEGEEGEEATEELIDEDDAPAPPKKKKKPAPVEDDDSGEEVEVIEEEEEAPPPKPKKKVKK